MRRAIINNIHYPSRHESMTATQTAKYWQAKLDDLSRTELDTVRSTAAKWQGIISTLLGIFGTVAFVSGNQTIEKLSPTTATFTKVAVTVAVALAVGAVLTATYAALGLPRQRESPDWRWLETQSRRQAGRALVALRWSQGLALGAVFVVIAGSLLVLWNSEPQAASQTTSVLVRSPDGSLLCGSLVGQDGVPAFKTPNGTVVHFAATTQFVGVINNCPGSQERR
jgi:hypothetical protein